MDEERTNARPLELEYLKVFIGCLEKAVFNALSTSNDIKSWQAQ